MAADDATDARPLDDLERALLDDFQRDFPLTPRPYAELAGALGATERTVLDALARLQEAGVVSRVGPVFTPHRAGHSTLAAMAVPPERLDEVAALVSSHPEVNHNYEREHELNLWFVVAASSEARVGEVLAEIEAGTGLEVLDLPLVEAYRLDLGFPLTWS
jgi:DNA-binding Lrp family transcriptional regulator